MVTEFQLPTEYYWAAEEDLEILPNHLTAVIEGFWDALDGSLWAQRIRRNHEYYRTEYYKNQSARSHSGLEMVTFGRESEFAAIPVNDFRSLLDQLVTLVTMYRPAWDTRAMNADAESLSATRLGNALLDWYMLFRDVESVMRRGVRNSVLENIGWIYTYWDRRGGSPAAAQETLLTGFPKKMTGDVALRTPGVQDVVFDLSCTEPAQIQWVAIRCPVNKWDLIAQMPEAKAEILENAEESSERQWDQWQRRTALFAGDRVDTWRFYHLPCDAIPDGRYVELLGNMVLDEGPWEFDWLPVDQIQAGERPGTCLGHSPANDLQGMAEWLAGEVAAILTAHKALGLQAIWAGPPGSPIKREDLHGLKVVRSDEQPKPLSVLDTPEEVLAMPDRIVGWMERVLGINAVSRGKVDREMSGTALALIDAKSIQSSSFLQSQYYRALEGVGQKILQLLAKEGGDSERNFAIVGRWNRVAMHKFVANRDLKPIQTVAVISGNALSKTPAGRKAIAEDLLKSGMIRTPEEYFNVITTGQLDSLLAAELGELQTIADENAKLLEGQDVPVSPIDNHRLHIREHHSLLNSVEMRHDTAMSAKINAHMMLHANMLSDLGIQILQDALGFQVPQGLQMVAQAGGPPGQGGPGGPGKGEVPTEGSGNPDGNPAAMAPPPRVPASYGASQG